MVIVVPTVRTHLFLYRIEKCQCQFGRQRRPAKQEWGLQRLDWISSPLKRPDTSWESPENEIFGAQAIKDCQNLSQLLQFKIVNRSSVLSRPR